MIFKTFDSDIDKISAKWGIFGKSFNDIGNAIIGRISDINKGFQATDDLVGSIKNSDSIWKRLYPNKETIQSQLINVDSAFFSSFSIGDIVTIRVRPVVYNGKLYLSGDNIVKGGNPYGEC